MQLLISCTDHFDMFEEGTVRTI